MAVVCIPLYVTFYPAYGGHVHATAKALKPYWRNVSSELTPWLSTLNVVAIPKCGGFAKPCKNLMFPMYLGIARQLVITHKHQLCAA